MFSMTLICMGKLKEKFYIQASEEYKKRLGAFCDFTLLELPEVRLPENPNETQILQGLSKEAELIRAKVPKGSWLCIFAPEGKLLSSEELAGKLSELKKRQIERVPSYWLVVRRRRGGLKTGGLSSFHEPHDVSASSGA